MAKDSYQAFHRGKAARHSRVEEIGKDLTSPNDFLDPRVAFIDQQLGVLRSALLSHDNDDPIHKIKVCVHMETRDGLVHLERERSFS